MAKLIGLLNDPLKALDLAAQLDNIKKLLNNPKAVKSLKLITAEFRKQGLYYLILTSLQTFEYDYSKFVSHIEGPMEGVLPGMAEIPEDLIKSLGADGANKYWDTWTVRAREALDEFRKDWDKAGGIGNVGRGIGERISVDQHVDLSTSIDNIEIKLPDNALDRVAEETARQIEEKLKSDEDLAKKIAKIIRPWI